MCSFNIRVSSTLNNLFYGPKCLHIRVFPNNKLCDQFNIFEGYVINDILELHAVHLIIYYNLIHTKVF